MFLIVTSNISKEENNDKSYEKSNKFHSKPLIEIFCYICFHFKGEYASLVKKGIESMNICRVHHVAIICSNYDVSKDFYTRILGFKEVNEVYRKERDSYKLDLCVGRVSN